MYFFAINIVPNNTVVVLSKFKAFAEDRLTFYKPKILDESKLKSFSDDKINVTKSLKLVLERVENIMQIEKMLIISIFSFSHNVFKRLLIQVC